MWEYYQKNPQALNEIRAPLFEEKVVDHIITVAKVIDKLVSRDELIAADEEGDEKPKAAKKAKPKAELVEEEEESVEPTVRKGKSDEPAAPAKSSLAKLAAQWDDED